MADNPIQRSYRAPDRAGRNSPAGASDPLAELARLIGQSDPFAEYGRDTARRAPPPREPTVDWSAPSAPGYAPQTPQDFPPPPPARPVEPYEAAHYAQDDHYHAEADAPGYASHPDDLAHAEAGGYEQPYDDASLPYAAEDQAYEHIQPRRHRGLMAIAAVFVLALLGTAGAFGYRAYFGKVLSGPPPIIKAESKPSKIVPVKKDTAKLIQERITPQGEKLVTREEKPIDIQNKPVGVFAQNQPGGQANAAHAPILGSGVIGGEPKKIHTIVIRPDQPNAAAPGAPQPPTITRINPATQPPAQKVASAPPPAPATQRPVAQPQHPAAPPAPHQPVAQAAPRPPATKPAPPHAVAQAALPPHPTARPAPPPHHVAAAPPPRNAPLSLSPSAPARAIPTHAPPMRLASVAARPSAPPATHSGGYAVQVSSRRSEADAAAAFRSMQAKYPTQLRGQHSLVRRVDLGKKGVYYRSMIGPFANSEQASKLCNSLKAAGVHCFVQRI
jgi:SPOR domain